MAVVEFIHQVDEAACGIVAQAVEHGDAAQQQGVEFAPDLDVVARSTRSLAQGIEIEPGHARAARTHGDPAPFQHDAAIAVRLAAAQLLPSRLQPGFGAPIERRAVHRRAGQGAQPVVGFALDIQLVAVRLDQVDGRQEARALQAIAVQVRRGHVGGGHQHDALGKHAFQQARQDHGIADIAHEELVQHQHPQPGPAPAAHDQRQPVALAAVHPQLLVYLAHETVEVGAVLARRALAGSAGLAGGAGGGQVGALEIGQRQGGVQQVHQEGLAAAHPAPQIEALDVFIGRGAAQPVQQAAPRRRPRGGGMDPVQFAQHRALGGVILPAAFGNAGVVGLGGGHCRRWRRLPWCFCAPVMRRRQAGAGARRSSPRRADP